MLHPVGFCHASGVQATGHTRKGAFHAIEAFVSDLCPGPCPLGYVAWLHPCQRSYHIVISYQALCWSQILLKTEPLKKGTSVRTVTRTFGEFDTETLWLSGKGKHTCPAPSSHCNYRLSQPPPYSVLSSASSSCDYLTSLDSVPFPSDAHPASMETLCLLARQEQPHLEFIRLLAISSN